jgi:tetratricopeptide (TPR) repeat protein
VHGLNLVARRAARTLDHSEKTVQEIGEILNASLLLEGDIRTDGGEYSISTWITETDSGIERWNHIIEKPRERLAEVRRELPAAVAAELDLDTEPGAQVSDIESDVYPLFLEAVGLLKLPRSEESLGRAESLLETVISLSPDYLPARAALCRTYLDWFAYQRDVSDFERANEQCTETLATSEQNIEVLLALGDLNHLQGDYDAAESYYNQGLDMDSSNVELNLGLARVRDKQGLTDEAERLLKDIMLLEPGYWRIHARLGELYVRSGRSENAITAFSMAESLAPDEPSVINGLGAAFYYAGRFADAAARFERSLMENPSSSALSNSASVWLLAGEYGRAAQYYLQAAELAPTDFRVWSNLADAESQIPGREAEARAHYQLSLQLAEENFAVNGKDFVALYIIAWSAVNTGDSTTANENIEEALLLAPENPDVLYYAAQVYNYLGNRQLATTFMLDAVARGYSEAVIKATPALSGLFQSK